MKTVAQIITALGLFAVAAVLYLGIVEAQTFIRNQALNDCAQNYRLEYTDVATNTTVIKPIDDLYKQCLTEKGV